MIKIKYVQASGTQLEVPAAAGQSLMQVALANNVPGIDADCGGQCACGTCHVFIQEPWFQAFPSAKPEELAMLNFAEGSGPQSRLSCQLKLDPSHDGMIVNLPKSQH